MRRRRPEAWAIAGQAYRDWKAGKRKDAVPHGPRIRGCLRPQDRCGDAFVVGTLTGRSKRVLAGYLAKLGVEVAAGAPIFRTRSGTPYSKDTLGDDFRDIRAMVFGEDEKRTIADMRRSGTIEAKRGGATKEAIGEKLGNAFATSKFINDTYGSTVVQIVREVDEARRVARTKNRAVP